MRNARFFAALTVFGLAAATSQAVDVYATNHMANHPNLGIDSLIRFDSSDPSGYTTVGSLGVANTGFGGLEFDAEGNLWGYATFNTLTGGARSGLYRIDTATGAATVQGTISPQTLTDLAYNPVDQTMYGIFTQGLATSRLYSIDLDTGAVALAGTFSGISGTHNLVGLAIDSAGTFYVHDNVNNTIYKSNGLQLTELYGSDLQTVGSQGMTIDWSRGDVGYHAAVGQGIFPNYFSQLNTFATDGSAYTDGDAFGPNFQDGLVPVQAGDLAIMPVPGPGTLLPLLALAPLSRRRRG